MDAFNNASLSDPYLKINVLDHLKRKTKPQFKTLNPTFHESFKMYVIVLFQYSHESS
jgi:Ca2+-dependent lipid-binding protein